MARILQVSPIVLRLLVFISLAGVALSQGQDRTAAAAAAPQSCDSCGCDVHWSYEGADGPANWAKLSPCYAACAGRTQSPVAIASPSTSTLTGGVFQYTPSSYVLWNNGHTIEAQTAGANSFAVDGASYGLVQFHFHRHSEHTLNGQPFALELHLVHRHANGSLAVVAVFLDDTKKPPIPNPSLEVLFHNLPAATGDRVYLPELFNVANLLPPIPQAIRYTGSLTTPPCTEGVRWWVLDTPIRVSPEQVAKFATLFPDDARPIQPLNGRALLRDRTPSMGKVK
jgi:carbonic anhydrase